MRFILPVAALLIAAPAQAQTQLCVELADFVEQQATRGGIVRPLSGAPAQAAIAWYNATPPVENATFDLVVIVENPDGSAAFHYGNDDAVCVRLSMTKETWAKVRERFVGRPA